MMETKLYNIGMYLRLSRESRNYRGGESDSIENQRAMLAKFASMMPGWVVARTYIDDGASGGNFERQGFKDMMEDVRGGVINLVFVKDLSRFGRNYLEAGRYLEEELPSLGCRFVALSDGIDTETGENDIMPFLNAMNDYYLKNLSERIKVVLTAKAKDGQKLSGTAPYGYERSAAKNTQLVIDEFAAGVVRRMFELRASGMGYASIAGLLNNEGILPPRRYYFSRQNRKTTAVCSDIWAIRTVKLILNNELYAGHTVAFKRTTRSYRDGRAIPRDESDWIRTENTHAPIVPPELWQAVQSVNAMAKTAASDRANAAASDHDEPCHAKPGRSLFSGLVVCADCRKNMGFKENACNGRDGRIVKYGNYFCRTHARSGSAACSPHRVSERHLKELVLEHIREMAALISLDEARMRESLQERLLGTLREDRAALAKERRELEQQIYALEMRQEQLYEDKVARVISADTFAALAGKLEERMLVSRDRLSALKKSAEQVQAKRSDIREWMRLITEKSVCDEVDSDLLERLVERIEIGEERSADGAKSQDIRIFYKYIGSF